MNFKNKNKLIQVNYENQIKEYKRSEWLQWSENGYMVCY